MVLLAGTAVGCSSDRTDEAEPLPIDRTPESTTPSGPTAAARWEDVTTLKGAGTEETAVFAIAPGAIQWRVQWSCESGLLRVESIPPPRKPVALVDAGCPGQGDGYSILTGDIRLRVGATAAWTLLVQQQVDTPLAEAPLPGMDPDAVIAAGRFYDIERTGSGLAQLFNLPDGRRALRLDPFEISQNTDLYVWLSEAAEPRTSADAVSAPHMEIALLKSTLGSQNYVLPDSLSIASIGSVVIWCEPVRIAYSAASLPA